MKILKYFEPIEGWLWCVYIDNEGIGLHSKTDTGWYDHPDVFETVEEAVQHAEEWATMVELDAYLTKSSGGAL